MTTEHHVDALLVGFESQENLGLRYIMSYLQSRSFTVQLVPFDPADPQAVVDAALETSPKLIGFSIIFQYTIDDFKVVTSLLREAGISSHFTAGGHFPSLRPRETLGELPALDSVVRFEGEITAAELLSQVNQPDSWSSIQGLAFRRKNDIVVTPARPLVKNLDDLPWPARSAPAVVRNIPTASMLASRGCCFDCAFCSIRQFYGSAPGVLRRTRSPEDVVAEMRHLFERHGVRMFIFHDDDFAAKTGQQRRWMEHFLALLDEAELGRKIAWKISCRADDVNSNPLFEAKMRGLASVYVGIESGRPDGLAILNKRTTVEQNLRALRILEEVGLAYDIGFMLFDPDITLDGLRANLHFLREVAHIGRVPISFAKMMPLAGTPIEYRLRGEKRLTGTAIRPDYDLIEPRADCLALFITLHFSFRNSSPRGLVERLRAAQFDFSLARTFETGTWIEDYGVAIQNLVDRANASALGTLDDLLDIVSGLPETIESVPSAWGKLTDRMRIEHASEVKIMADIKKVLRHYSPGLYQTFINEDQREAEDAFIYY